MKIVGKGEGKMCRVKGEQEKHCFSTLFCAIEKDNNITALTFLLLHATIASHFCNNKPYLTSKK